MYGLIWLTDLRSTMDSIDLLTLLTSAVCHDLDHTGYNNAYQVTKTANGLPSVMLVCRHTFPNSKYTALCSQLSGTISHDFKM